MSMFSSYFQSSMFKISNFHHSFLDRTDFKYIEKRMLLYKFIMEMKIQRERKNGIFVWLNKLRYIIIA